MSALLGALAGGAMGIIGNTIQNRQNQNLASQQQQWSEQMQASQQDWDLAQWERMNLYNSPQAQMARFAAAGLNPHLIYGKGNPGNAMPLRSPDIKPYSRAQAKNVMEGINVFGQHYQFKNLQAQTDNVEAQAENTRADTKIKYLERIEKFLSNDKLMAQQPYFKDMAWAEMEKALQDLRIGDEKETLLHYQGEKAQQEVKFLTESFEHRIKQMMLTNDAIGFQNVVKEFEAGLAKAGISPKEPLWSRMLVNALQRTGAMDWLFEQAKKGFKYATKNVR